MTDRLRPPGTGLATMRLGLEWEGLDDFADSLERALARGGDGGRRSWRRSTAATSPSTCPGSTGRAGTRCHSSTCIAAGTPTAADWATTFGDSREARAVSLTDADLPVGGHGGPRRRIACRSAPRSASNRGVDRVDYDRSRALMAAEANAAIDAAFDGGADEVVVNDSHWQMRNLRAEDIDPRARLLIGDKPFSMTEGIGDGAAGGYDAAAFVGYHAGAGHPTGVIGHTYSSAAVARASGSTTRRTTRPGINAIRLGHHGVPVVLVAGDDALADEVAIAPAVGGAGDREASARLQHRGRALAAGGAADAIRERDGAAPSAGLAEMRTLPSRACPLRGRDRLPAAGPWPTYAAVRARASSGSALARSASTPPDGEAFYRRLPGRVSGWPASGTL